MTDRTVCLLHGFPDTPATFSELKDHLESAGADAHCPWLLGYADGDRCPTSLDDVVDALIRGWQEAGLEQVDIVGHDWGAVVGFLAAARVPERVRSLTALAIPPLRGVIGRGLRYPARLRQLAYMAAFQLPYLPELALARRATVEALWTRWSPGFALPAPALDAALTTLNNPQTRRNVLSYYRNLAAWWQRDTRAVYRGLSADIHPPTLVIHGADDGCMPAELFPATPVDAPQLKGPAKIVCLPDAGHFLHLERPKRVARLILDWLDAVG